MEQPGPEEPQRLTPEQVKLGKKKARQTKIINTLWDKLGYVRLVLLVVGLAWITALPHPALWKSVFHDEHALQPAQVNTYYNWADVFRADKYLADVEGLQARNATWDERSRYLLQTFRAAGIEAGNTTQSVWARVAPPRSEGTEAILLSANWMSRDGVPNMRGVAMLLSYADFLRSQNHWAFDIFLVVGEGYLHGLQDWITNYNPRANIWTALNLDYPYHSFSHIGIFYEGVNGRLPNQDVINTAATVCWWSAQVDHAMHTLPNRPPRTYKSGLQHLVEHFKYAALGRPSAAHGLLAKHRIDAITFYANPSEHPHGFHTLGRAIEGTLRSFNNLLERLHASFFFYLLPDSNNFLPVGHYLPAAVLLGASVTLGGFDCRAPLEGVTWLILPALLGLLGWFLQSPLVVLIAFFLPRPQGDAKKSLLSLAHLGYGALIPTLAMVNFPQAVLLAVITIVALAPLPTYVKLMLAPLNPALLAGMGIDLQGEWELVGNLAWPGVFAVWVPLAAISNMT